MKVALWAEIRRLFEIEKLSKRAIAQRLSCSRKTVDRALELDEVPSKRRSSSTRPTKLDPFKKQIQAIIQEYPRLSAVRIMEKITTGDGHSPGYSGGISQLKTYLKSIRPVKGRVYQDISYASGEAIQVDWGDVGSIKIHNTIRRVSVFVAVLCYSRMCYIEFTLSQRKCEFYRSTVNALKFFGGSPKKIIFDNLKAAVISGSGRTAVIHPEFLALCGHYCMEPIACTARDPQSKGMVENTVRYVKHNALQGRDDELQSWEDYHYLAVHWRDEVANVRLHERFHQRPIERFEVERLTLRPLPSLEFNTDEVLPTEVRPIARIEFDGNRYSVPPRLVRKTVLLRADPSQLRIFFQGEQVAAHARCYGRRELIVDPQHQLEAFQMRRKVSASEIEKSFSALGEEARQFYLQLTKLPVRPLIHLKRIMELLRLYGRHSVVLAIKTALQYQTFDAAYVETLVHQERRKLSLPSPTVVQPKRKELGDIELDAPDLSRYDRFTKDQDP
jgi:transposase